MIESSPARGTYLLAAIAAIVSASAIFWKGRAVYRHLLFGEPAATGADILVITICVLVVQVAFWRVLVKTPPFKLPRNLLLSNIVLFVSRISFMLAGALFSIVVFVRLEELSIRFPTLVLFTLVLFTIFCFSRWLEQIGRALGGEAERH